MNNSLNALAAELLIAIYSKVTDLRTLSSLAATSRAFQAVWQTHQRLLITQSLLHQTPAWSSAVALAQLQTSIETCEPSLSNDFALPANKAPRYLNFFKRHIFATKLYAESAMRSFLEEWVGQLDRGPPRSRAYLLPLEIERFHKAFYDTAAFVIKNHAKKKTAERIPQSEQPEVEKLDLSLIDLFKMVEMTVVLWWPPVKRPCMSPSPLFHLV